MFPAILVEPSGTLSGEPSCRKRPRPLSGALSRNLVIMPSKADQIRVRERLSKAMDLRISGLSYKAIADELGYGSPSQVHREINKELARRGEEEAEKTDELRTIELDRLEELWSVGWELLHTEHATVSHGKVIYREDPVTGDRSIVPDPAPRLAAIDRLVRISERKAKLTGVDRPQVVEHTGSVRYEIVGVSLEDLGVITATPTLEIEEGETQEIVVEPEVEEQETV